MASFAFMIVYCALCRFAGTTRTGHVLRFCGWATSAYCWSAPYLLLVLLRVCGWNRAGSRCLVGRERKVLDVQRCHLRGQVFYVARVCNDVISQSQTRVTSCLRAQ